MKKILLEILDFFRYKIENDKCTPEDMRTAFKVLNSGVIVDATTNDLAEFYGQSESNVRNVLARKPIGKIRHENLYNFVEVSKSVPETWKGGKE